MNDKAREQIRERLLEERKDLLETLADFDDRFRERLEQGDDDLSRYPQHMADDGTNTIEQETEFLLASQDGRQLLDVDEALRKLYKEPERFGICENCGREISMERMEIVPSARLCIDCKRSAESETGAASQGGGADAQGGASPSAPAAGSSSSQ